MSNNWQNSLSAFSRKALSQLERLYGVKSQTRVIDIPWVQLSVGQQSHSAGRYTFRDSNALVELHVSKIPESEIFDDEAVCVTLLGHTNYKYPLCVNFKLSTEECMILSEALLKNAK